VFFKDGSSTEKVEVEYPLGHRRRRAEGMPLLLKKFKANLASRLPAHRVENILNVCHDPGRLEAMPVHEFVEYFVV
jgi:2-methylcitrate dehydratase